MAQANGSHDCSKFVPPRSLKDLLDFFAALDVKNGHKCGEQNGATGATKAAFEELRDRLTGGKEKNGWIPDGQDGANFSKNTNGTREGIGCSIFHAINELKKLRDKILGTDEANKFGIYDNIAKETSDPCIKTYADAIIQNAFPLFGCLFYLWFMCDNDCNS